MAKKMDIVSKIALFNATSSSNIINFYFQHVAPAFLFWLFLFHWIHFACSKCSHILLSLQILNHPFSLYAMYSTQQTNISLRFIILYVKLFVFSGEIQRQLPFVCLACICSAFYWMWFRLKSCLRFLMFYILCGCVPIERNASFLLSTFLCMVE